MMSMGSLLRVRVGWRVKISSVGTCGVEPAKAELIQFGQKYLQAERAVLNTDQLGTAQKKGLIGSVAPLDFESFGKGQSPQADVDALASQIRARTAQAQAVGDTLERTPQFLRPESGHVMLQLAALGLIFVLLGLFSTIIFATSAGRLGNLLRRNPAVLRWQGKVVGGIYCALGIRLALQQR